MGAYPQQRTPNIPSQIQAFIQAQGFGLNSSTPSCLFGLVPGVVEKILLCNRTQLLDALINVDGQVEGFANNPLTTWYVLNALTNRTTVNYDAPSNENGNVYITTMSGQAYYSSTILNQWFARTLNQPLAAIVKDRKGAYWLLGNDQPLRRKSLLSKSGAAGAELNGYEWTLATTERTPPLEVLPDVAANLVLDPNVNCSLPYNVTLNILTFGTCNISAFGSVII